MSFSQDTKNELVKIKNVSTSAALCELMGCVAFGGRLRREKGVLSLTIVTENPKTARRIYQLIKDTVGVTSKVKISKTSNGKAKGVFKRRISYFGHSNEPRKEVSYGVCHTKLRTS